MLTLGTTHASAALRLRTGTPAAQNGGYHLILYMGNSAAVGRDANAGYEFPSEVQEFNQAGAFATAGTSYGTGGTIDAADSNNSTGSYTPAVAMCTEYLAQNPDLDGLILVPQCQGNTSLSDNWAVPDGVDTVAAKARLEAAYAAADAAGLTVTKTLFTYMTLGSDLNSSASANIYEAKLALFDTFINYWLDQSQTDDTAFALNTGLATLSGSDVNSASHTQYRRTWSYRQDNVGVVDFQSFPQGIIDKHGHADTETNHHEIGPRLATALSGAGARKTTAFETLSFFGDLDGSYPQNVPLFDEVTQTTRAALEDTNAPYYEEVTASGKTFTGSVSTGSRVAAIPFTHTTQWTIMWSGVVRSFASTFGLFQNTSEQVRMYHSTSTGWTFGTDGVAGSVAPSVAAGALITMALSFDNGTLRLYENGVEVATAADAVPTLNIEQLAIGAQNRLGAGPMDGITQHVAVAGRVLSASEIAEYDSTARL